MVLEKLGHLTILGGRLVWRAQGIQIASGSKMQVRSWLILCRLKKQEKGEGSSGVRDSRLAGVEQEVVGPHWKQCFVVLLHGWLGWIVFMED